MRFYEFKIDAPVAMDMTGKFMSPFPEWIHMNRILLEYELFIQTRGTLYLSNGTENFTLREGEFLLMPPRSKQYGYRESDCSFYWLHFSTKEFESFDDADYEHIYKPGMIVIPQTGVLRSSEKLIVMLKQLQDSIRSYQEENLNNYLTTSMEVAKYLLTDTNQKIIEISIQLSFPDSQSFTKAFKKIIGLTPTEYRNAYANRLLNS